MTQSLFMGMAGAVLVPSSIPSDDGVLTICNVPSWHMGPAWTFPIPSQYVLCFFLPAVAAQWGAGAALRPSLGVGIIKQ